MQIPNDRTELIKFLRDLANSLEMREIDFAQAQITTSIDHVILPGGLERDLGKMMFTINIHAETERAHWMLSNFNKDQEISKHANKDSQRGTEEGHPR